MAETIFGSQGRTFYCDCAYNGKRVDYEDCSYKPPKPNKRSQHIEWEHVVPAHAFGQSFVEWREGHPSCKTKRKTPGRKCARKASPEFRKMEADLYNLYPVIGDVNQKRSNYSFAELPGEPRKFGACDLELENRKVEPRDAIRGDIARVYFYMDATYPGRSILSSKNRKLFEAWAKLDPPDEAECSRYEKIRHALGSENPILAPACRSLAARSKEKPPTSGQK